MESSAVKHQGRGGFILLTVLIIAAVGLLFGAGALLLFRYQCQLRIDRQHELEKVYSVRSALNYARTASDIPDGGKLLEYHTGSGRDLDLLVKPVPCIFPQTNNAEHLFMELSNPNRNFQILSKEYYQYTFRPDYEYGSIGDTNVQKTIRGRKDDKYGLVFDAPDATNSVKWWVNIGMRETGGWIEETYGRRYCFKPENFVGESDSSSIKDVLRLCIIRSITNENNKVGCRHGWPLSQEGERALVFQLNPLGNVRGGSSSNITLSEYYVEGGVVKRSSPIVEMQKCEATAYMGLQIAADKVTLFYCPKNQIAGSKQSLGYEFSETKSITDETYRYFLERRKIGGIWYGGTNVVNGKVRAPELRAVFEVEAMTDNRSSIDYLTEFSVTPGYQFDIYLKNPMAGTNFVLATVAQKYGINSRFIKNSTMLTDDTHGTEHKGFRQDEKEAARNNNR